MSGRHHRRITGKSRPADDAKRLERCGNRTEGSDCASSIAGRQRNIAQHLHFHAMSITDSIGVCVCECASRHVIDDRCHPSRRPRERHPIKSKQSTHATRHRRTCCRKRCVGNAQPSVRFRLLGNGSVSSGTLSHSISVLTTSFT